MKGWKPLAWKLLAWACGVFLVVSSLRLPFQGIWIGAIVMLLSGLICLPPVRTRIAALSPIKGHPIITIVAVFALLSVAVSLVADEAEAQATRQEKADRLAIRERIAKAREQADTDFRQNKRAILASAQAKSEAGQHASARAEIARFSYSTDPDFVRLWTAVSLAALHGELAQSPAEDRQAAIYAEIARLDPSDIGAAAKATLLKGTIEDARKLRASIDQRKAQIESQLSKWDGSHPAAVEAVKGRMKNPRSFEHVETRYLDPGSGTFSVYMTYRGTNSFNAVVTNTAVVLVSMSGQVVSIN